MKATGAAATPWEDPAGGPAPTAVQSELLEQLTLSKPPMVAPGMVSGAPQIPFSRTAVVAFPDPPTTVQDLGPVQLIDFHPPPTGVDCRLDDHWMAGPELDAVPSDDEERDPELHDASRRAHATPTPIVEMRRWKRRWNTSLPSRSEINMTPRAGTRFVE